MGGVGGALHDAVGLLEHRAKKMSRRMGEGTMIFAAVFTVPWRGQFSVATAVPVPDSDAAGQHTLNGAPVECGEDGWWETCSFQPAEKVQALLCLFGE